MCFGGWVKETRCFCGALGLGFRVAIILGVLGLLGLEGSRRGCRLSGSEGSAAC